MALAAKQRTDTETAGSLDSLIIPRGEIASSPVETANTSIIIPTCNVKGILAGCIRSIRKHTGVPHQEIH